MQQIPLSDSISAPASRHISPVSTSRPTPTVRPAAEDDFPEVYTERGEMLLMYFRNCDFAVDGSPTIQMLMSPRMLPPSAVCLWTPPISCSSSPRLMSSWP
mgnify:FL=1